MARFEETRVIPLECVVYKLEQNRRFPSPTHEIEALIDLARQNPGSQPWLKLSPRTDAPGVGHRCKGCRLYLCEPNPNKNDLVVLAEARIVENSHLYRGVPPKYLRPIYGDKEGNFLKIEKLKCCDKIETVTQKKIMTEAEVATFLGGQPYCKYIDTTSARRKRT